MMTPPVPPVPRMRTVCPHLARSPQESTTQVFIAGGDLGVRGPVEIDLCRECGDLVMDDLPPPGDGDDDLVELVRRLMRVWPEVFG